MTDTQTDQELPPAFTRLWIGSGVSALGDGVYLAALPLLALSVTHDPMQLSLISGIGVLPWLLFGLVGGALVDRMDRRRTMVATDVARGALLAVAAGLAAFGHASVALLMTIGFLLGVAQIFFESAASAYLPQLLSRDVDLLQKANARRMATHNVAAEFIGPPTGGLLFGLGAALPFVANAVSYVGSAALIWTLPRMPVPAASKNSLLADAREGVGYVVRNGVLLGFALRFTIGNMAFMAADAVLVLFAHTKLHLGTTGFGVLLAAQAIGGLGGAVLARRIGTWFRTGTALTLTASLEAVSMLVLGLSSSAYVAGAALALCGLAMSATMVIGPSVSQAIVPVELTGRVSATNRLFAFGAAPFGALLGGFVAGLVGVRGPFLCGAALLAVMTVVTGTMAGASAIDAAIERARRDAAATPAEAAAVR